MQAIAMLAQFQRHYSASLYRCDRYRTRDRVIPFGAFWIYYREIPHTLALERVSAMRAVINAIASSFRKEGAPTPESVRADRREARLETD